MDKQIKELATEILQEFTNCYSEADEECLVKMIKKVIPENAVVLTREEAEKVYNIVKEHKKVWEDVKELKADFTKEMYALKKDLKKDFEEHEQAVRKETAEKFAEMLKEKSYRMFSNGGNFEFTIDTKSLDEICKEIAEGKK